MSYYRQQLEDWLKTLDVKADLVYDVGGAQGHVDTRVKSWDVKEYKVLDLPEYDVDSNQRSQGRRKLGDVVFCLEVFEYLLDPLEALANLRRLTNESGKIYATFAFAYPHHNELELDSLRYTETGIMRLAERIHLKISNIWYRTDKSGLLQAFYSADGMHPAREYHHHDVTGFIVEFIR